MTSRFGAQLRAWAHRKGYRQARVAEEFDVGPVTVWRWFNGQTIPEPENLNMVRLKTKWPEEKLEYLLEDWYENHFSTIKYKIGGDAYVGSRYDGSYEDFVHDLFELGDDTMNCLSPEFLGPLDKRVPIFRESPQTWKVVTRDGEIVGSWQFICLKKAPFEKAMKRQLLDSEVSADMLEFPMFAGEYRAYFTAIILSSGHKSPAAFSALTDSLVRVIENFAVDEVYFSEIVTHAVTREGANICERMGMKDIGKHEHAKEHEFVQCYCMSGHEVKDSYLAKESNIIKEKYSKKYG